MQYLRNAKSLTMTIESGDEPKWCVDSSYAIHPDKRSHTGIYMTLGKGDMYTALCKQKLNTKSSKEEELVAVDDAMGQYYVQGTLSSTRTTCTNNNNIPGQQDQYIAIKKWKNIQLKKDT